MSTRIGKKYINKYKETSDSDKIIFKVIYDNGHQVVFTWKYADQKQENEWASVVTNYELNTHYKEYHEPVTEDWYLHLDKEGRPFVTKINDLDRSVFPFISYIDVTKNPETNEVISYKVIDYRESK